MARAKPTAEPELKPCVRCAEPATGTLCQRCCEIGGGYVPDPPEDCTHVNRSPIGDHRNVDITICAYRCGDPSCRWGKRFNRVGAEANVKRMRVTFKPKVKK